MTRFSLHTVVVGLVRRTWVLVSIVIVSCAVLAANALDALASARELAESPHGLPAPHTRPVTAVVPVARGTGDALVARDMFCSDCARTQPRVDRGLGDDAYADVPHALGAVLIATSVGRESFATVRVLASNAQGSWGIGDLIPRVGVVTEIEPANVFVLDMTTGRRARLSLLELAAVGSGTGAATPGAGSAAAPDEWAGRVKQLDDHTFEVDRSLVHDLMKTGGLAAGARVVPVYDHGAIHGVRFINLKPGSLPAAFGLHNADIIDTVDGQALDSANQLLDLVGKLDELPAVQLGGKRAGKPLTIDLHLR